MGAAMGTPGFGEVALESLEERQLRSGRGPPEIGMLGGCPKRRRYQDGQRVCRGWPEEDSLNSSKTR